MKRIMLILICCLGFLAGFSQNISSPKENSQQQINTLFGNEDETLKVPMGYFIEINGAYTKFENKGMILPGIDLGIILNHQWTIGLSGSFIANPEGSTFANIYYDTVSHTVREANLNGGFAGLLLEYTLFPKSKVHIAFPLKAEYGYLYYTELPQYSGSAHPYRTRHHAYISKDNLFVIEPGVRLELNVVKIIRLGFILSYRYSPDLKLINTSANLINQFTGKISLRFGLF
ncbi:MAG: hypothetical protein ABSD71_12175 [Bacteroidales bacterium]|jgi:hypothetical protein